MSQIDVVNLSFAYEGSYDWIFKNVSFRIDTDWKLGFVGRNGRGKTTFLQLLMNRYSYEGKISSSVNFDYFPFMIEQSDHTIEEIAMGICPDLDIWRLERELSLLAMPESYLSRPFAGLSGGEQVKALLAVLFLKENNFLLIDEPTNHLDLQARQAVSQYLKRKKGFILVSHDRTFLDGCIDHVLAINRADIEIQQGNFYSWQQSRQNRDNFERSENAKLQGEIKRLGEAARRSEKWSESVEKTKFGTRIGGLRPDRGYLGHKAAKLMQSAKNTQRRRENAVEEKTALLKNVERIDKLKLHPMNHHRAVLAEVHEVSLRYGERSVLAEFDFILRQGERIALTGKNGSGKTSVLKLLLGQITPTNGFIETATKLIISYVPQDTSFLQGTLAEFIAEHCIDEPLFKAILHKLDLQQVQFEKRLETYSSGQKKKVLLAKSLSERAHLYIWDEPLNFIDVLSRMQIEQLILEYRPTLLFVEHDNAFIKNIATRVLKM